MSETLQGIMDASRTAGASIGVDADREADAFGQVAASRVRQGEYDDTAQNSAPLNTMADSKVREALEKVVDSTLPKNPTKVSDELKALLAETKIDGEGPNAREVYAHPRHFAQLGNRRGFTLYIPTQNKDGPSMVEINFDDGVFTTNDIQICGALEFAIARKDGVSSQIRAISLAHYRSIIERGRAYENLKGIGIVSTTNTSGGRTGKPLNVLEDENESLRQQLAEMQERVAMGALTPSPSLAQSLEEQRDKREREVASQKEMEQLKGDEESRPDGKAAENASAADASTNMFNQT